MLEGPAGSLVEMELTSGVGAPSVIVLTRTEMDATHDSSGSGGELLGGEVGRVSVPATHSAAGAPAPVLYVSIDVYILWIYVCRYRLVRRALPATATAR